MGYSPLIWGKEAWRFIHFVALSYPEAPTEEDKINYYKFFESLQKVLPCPTCAYNFEKKMKEYPPNLENKKSLFRWTVDVHNSVNKENGKEIVSYEDAEKKLFADLYAPYLKGIFVSTALIGLILLTTKKLVK
jgi:hypothetical protein